MSIGTRLTERFGIRHPIVLAPMTPAAGGALASAVSAAGGLGMLGGGYGNREWYAEESARISHPRVGCGFITWAIQKDPGLLDLALERRPAAMMLSFADPMPLAPRIRQAGVPLICQVHTIAHALRAIDAGADVIVAQGTEAGGHGLTARATMSLVPEVVDTVAIRAPQTLVLAAGGIGDGRGLAAALMLGADGVLMGTRFWATREALIHPAAKRKVLAANGDETIRTRVYDIVRRKAWPATYTGRLLRNNFINTWHDREPELQALQPELLASVEAAQEAADFETTNVTVGEAIGLVHVLQSATEVVRMIAVEAEACLERFARRNDADAAPQDVASAA